MYYNLPILFNKNNLSDQREVINLEEDLEETFSNKLLIKVNNKNTKVEAIETNYSTFYSGFKKSDVLLNFSDKEVANKKDFKSFNSVEKLVNNTVVVETSSEEDDWMISPLVIRTRSRPATDTHTDSCFSSNSEDPKNMKVIKSSVYLGTPQVISQSVVIDDQPILNLERKGLSSGRKDKASGESFVTWNVVQPQMPFCEESSKSTINIKKNNCNSNKKPNYKPKQNLNKSNLIKNNSKGFVKESRKTDISRSGPPKSRLVPDCNLEELDLDVLKVKVRKLLLLVFYFR
jgi:hypothetical protein